MPHIRSLSRWIRAALLGALCSSSTLGAETTDVQNMTVFVGTYTGGDSRGIYSMQLDLSSGSLKSLAVTEGIKNPSFLAIHPRGAFLYAVSEVADYAAQNTGAVTAFAITPHSGRLTLLNHASSGGAGPCHLVVDQTGRHVLVANYGGGSVASLPIGEDGRVGPPTSFIQHQGSSVNPRRQQSPHAHSINLDANNRFAFAADLGLDKVLIYRFDARSGQLTPNSFPHVSLRPGAGPRHFAIHPTNQYAYVINELSCTVTAFALDANSGSLESLQTISTLPAGRKVQEGYSTAEVQVHPSGHFLYGSNRGHDSIVVYRINSDTGMLTYVENESTQGRTPRNFGIDPTGHFLLAANQSSHNIVVFRIDHETGALEPAGAEVKVPSPVCVKFLVE